MASGIIATRDFQVARQMAWHKKTILKQPERSDFPEIEKAPLFFNGEPLVFTRGDRRNEPYSIYVSKDDGKPVGIPFKDSYNTLLPHQAWDWVHDVLSGTGFEVVSLGMIWNRSQWFITTKLKELESLTLGGRLSKFLLNASGGLDKSYSPQMELSSQVIYCANSLAVSRMTGEVFFKEKATRNFNIKLEEKKAEVEKMVGMTAVFKAAMDSLASKPCNKDRAERIFAGFVTPAGEEKMSTRTKNVVDELTGLHSRGIGNKGETEFDALNAYTQLGTRGNEDWKSWARGEFGSMADKKAEFAQVLVTNDERLENIEARGEQLLFV